jgi:hypothetical protein
MAKGSVKSEEGTARRSAPKRPKVQKVSPPPEGPPAVEPGVDLAVAKDSAIVENVAVLKATEEPPMVASPQAANLPATLPDALNGVRLPAANGRAGVFGGPKDRSAKPDDRLALPTGLHYQYERVRSLNPKGFYCAMRWDYRQEHMSTEEGKRWWANKKLQVKSPATGKSVIVRAVDFGPHENTGHSIAISPAAAGALNIQPGDEVEITFADQRAAPGLVSK